MVSISFFDDDNDDDGGPVAGCCRGSRVLSHVGAYYVK